MENKVVNKTVNINRMRTGDKIKLESGKELTVSENWMANGIYQMIPVEEPDSIYSFNIMGKNLDPNFKKANIVEFTEVPNESDNKTFYVPKFDIDLLPVIHINGEDRFIYRLDELNGLEVKGDQTLKSGYKYTVIAMLQKKHGRDIEVIKEQKIICESKDDSMKTLDRIAKQFTGENLELTELQKIFDNLKEKVDN